MSGIFGGCLEKARSQNSPYGDHLLSHLSGKYQQPPPAWMPFWNQITLQFMYYQCTTNSRSSCIDKKYQFTLALATVWITILKLHRNCAFCCVMIQNINICSLFSLPARHFLLGSISNGRNQYLLKCFQETAHWKGSVTYWLVDQSYGHF